ncbi:MAG: single-stranded-DNA-specific exonuclease RecJ [Deltaproteobacteria bacterium]|nr:single-stranded-DNA-specific exonuclease RecJ [Deltaproteobacteria bacterium]
MTKVWKLKPPSPYALQLARKTAISALKAQILINRGISDSSSVKSFLSPRLSNLIDPMLLKDMDMAIGLILKAIENRKKITIYGDYDADGITATTLLLNLFSSLHIPASYYIPNRINEGYGLNPDAVEKIAEKGTGLIITVDCGTANKKEISLARRLGMEVVVTDHHQIPEDFNPICPVINPHRPDSSFPFKNLAGVGISFFLAIAIRAALRERGWFRKRPEPDLRHYLDLVALGTVADMVPLLDQNRILVRAGIETMKTSIWPGIKAIQEISQVDIPGITSHDLAFRLAPRINAPGRMGGAEIGVKALTTDQPPIAMALAKEMNTINSQRQDMERHILTQIEETIIPKEDMENRKTLVLSDDGWHMGVLGIVASRLLEKYHRPTLILSIRDGMATGSGRSIDGFNLHKALTRLGHLFERFGGHYHAAGFTLKASNIEALSSGLEDLARQELRKEDLIPVIEVDGEVMLSDITMDTVSDLNSLFPFGSKNPEPLFYTHSLSVLDSRVVGGRHLKLRVKQGGIVMGAIGFGLSDRDPLQGESINMVFTPEIDQWQGYKKVQLKIIDLEVKGQGSKLTSTMT